MLDLVDINTNDTNSTKYSIKLLPINTKVVTKESLKPINVPEITLISISL